MIPKQCLTDALKSSQGKSHVQSTFGRKGEVVDKVEDIQAEVAIQTKGVQPTKDV